MQLRRLGSSGVRVSAIGLGSNQFGGVVDQNGVHNILSLARELEINLIDTANAYTGGESERLLGRALRGQRDSFLVATKAFFPVGPGPNDRGTSRYHLLRAVEDSLRRLQTDHIDLYQMHRWDWRTPIEQTMRTLDDLVSAGKVRYIGASNYMSWQLAQANLLAQFNAWEPLVSVQSHFHMLERQVEDEVLPFCEQGGLGFIPYFPLAGGFLTGKYTRTAGAPPGSRGESSAYVQRYMTDANYGLVERLEVWAREREHTMAELAQAWLLARPEVCSVISGVTRPDQLRANARAADWQLTSDEYDEVNAILDGDT
ncbi:MAG: aldo/keto reductase [Anaerolineaceae bacterium]|nr:aldo/keto reductase [Anaerolineaceae bacterium]